jgi:hypothetical protein
MPKVNNNNSGLIKEYLEHIKKEKSKRFIYKSKYASALFKYDYFSS